MSKTLYYAQVEGTIDGMHRSINDPLNLTAREAKYLIMSGLIATEKKVIVKEFPASTEPSSATLDMKTRKS